MAMVAAISSGDSYTTPQGIRRSFLDYLFLGTRWGPYFSFFGVIYRYWGSVLKGLYDDEKWAKSAIEVLRGLERCGAKFSISGLDILRGLTGPVVFVSNHMSTLETLLLPALIVPIVPATFVVKSELVKGLIWGP